MDLTFGTKLRLQRERQRIELTTIAQQTKIKQSLLEALERDDVSHWPDGIFRRAYLRTYAEAIGLEPGEVVREFLEIHPCADVLPKAPMTPSDANGESGPQHPPTRLRFLISSAIAALPPVMQRAERQEPAVASPMPSGRNSFGKPSSTSAPPPPPAPCSETETADSIDPAPASRRFNLLAVADLCARFARALDLGEMEVLLEDTASVLGAIGLIVWSWDSRIAAMKPLLACGYSGAVLARLPSVRRDADNAIAAAFRSAEPRLVSGDHDATGAVVVPLIAATGCVGVFAVELPNGYEQHEDVRAVATILAAQLVVLVGLAPWAQAVNA